MLSRREQASHKRRVRFLHRLRHDIAGGHGEELALEARIGRHGHHVGGVLTALLPHRAFEVRVDAEPFHLHQRGTFAGTPFSAAIGKMVQRRQGFSDAGRVVIIGRCQLDAMAQADVLGPLRGGGEE